MGPSLYGLFGTQHLPNDVITGFASQARMSVAMASYLHPISVEKFYFSPRHIFIPTLVYKASDDEEGGHETIPLKQGVGIGVLVSKAIIES